MSNYPSGESSWWGFVQMEVIQEKLSSGMIRGAGVDILFLIGRTNANH